MNWLAGRRAWAVRASLMILMVSVSCWSPSSAGAGPPSVGQAARCAASTNASSSAVRERQAQRRYEYIFRDGAIDVFDMDGGHCQVKALTVPTTAGVRGVAASPASGMLYISYGGDGGARGRGSLLEYELRTDQVIWTRKYDFGIDSFDIAPDGKTIYMPEGELAAGSIWHIIDAASGVVRGSIQAGKGPHNTLLSRDGKRAYLGPRFDPHLYVVETSSGQIIRRIGPVKGDGVRPFTVNSAETLTYITESGFLGFQVAAIGTGKVLYTIPVRGFSVPFRFPASTPSHGITLSPDEREIYLIDTANSQVHVFDVNGVPRSAPRQVADIRLQSRTEGDEYPCAYDCLRDGWLQHSRDGRFVYVGDSGDVIDTASRRTVAVLEPLHNTRKMLEIDFDSQGTAVFATPREGVGYTSGGADSLAARSSP